MFSIGGGPTLGCARVQVEMARGASFAAALVLLSAAALGLLALLSRGGSIGNSPGGESPEFKGLSTLSTTDPAKPMVRTQPQHIPKTAVILRRARNDAVAAASRIHERYELHNSTWQQYFLIIWNMPDHAWDILKYKVASKLFQPDAEFVAVFSGSSVTAGYDNYYNQSYPLVFQRAMQGVFATLGVPLSVQNLGQHRINCKLHTYCVHSMAGVKSADFLGWENTYGCGRYRDAVEFAARLAAKYQAVLHISASGGMTPQHCSPSKDSKPWIWEDWQPVNSTEAQVTLSGRQFVARYRATLQRWYADGNAVSKFARFLQKSYKGVGVHGFNMWARSHRLCRPITPPAKPNATGCDANELFRDMCHSDGGPHFMTLEASTRSLDDQLARGWNPSVGMHVLRGELLAYNYLLIVLDALTMVEEDMVQLSAQAAAEKYVTQLATLQTAVPMQAESCAAWECDMSALPKCYSDYQPQAHSDQFGLGALVIGSHEGWGTETVKTGVNHDVLGYRDRKQVWKGLNGGYSLHLKLQDVRHGVVKLYGLGGRQANLVGVKVMLDPDVQILPTLQQYTPTINVIEHRNATYDEEVDQLHLHGLPRGNHVLTLVTPVVMGINEATALTHVVVF